MKKFLIFILGLGLIVSSCAKVDTIREDIEDTERLDSIPIGFGAGVTTKAIVNSVTDLQGVAAGVFAKINSDATSGSVITYDDATNKLYIKNEKLSYASSKWSLASTYLWPRWNGGEWTSQQGSTISPTATGISNQEVPLQFTAYMPYDANVTIAADAEYTNGSTTYKHDNAVKVPVEITGIGTDSQDLLFAKSLNQTYFTNTTTNGTVDFSFAHQLALIEFQAKTVTTFSSLTITKLELTGTFATKGDFTFHTADGSTSFSNTAAASKTYTQSTSTTVANGSTYTKVMDLIVIPQTFDNTVVVTITYDAKIGKVTYSNKTATIVLNTKHTDSKWEAGKKYTYKIEIDWKDILFSASVTNWTDGNTGGYVIY